MSKVGLTVCWLVIPLSFIAFNTSMAAVCGPGDHWVDGCASGLDDAPSQAMVGILVGGNCENADPQSATTVTLSGPTTIWRGDPVDNIVDHAILENIGAADGHNDVIETEIVSLNLTGSGYTVIAGDNVANLARVGCISEASYTSWLRGRWMTAGALSTLHLLFTELFLPPNTL